MTQHRYIDSGTFASASFMKELFTGLTAKTVLSGGDLGVSTPDRVTIAPIWLALYSPRVASGVTFRNNTVILFEDTVKTLQVPMTSAPVNYTIVYHHTDADVEGGVAAVLALESGLLRNENISDGLVVGWVLYTGGAVPLSQSMLVAAPKMRIEALSSPADGQYLSPPFTSFLYQQPAGPYSIVTNGYEDPTWRQVLVLDNQANAATSMTYLRWTFLTGRDQPRSIAIDYVGETGQSVTLDIQDTAGNCSANSLGPTVLAGMLVSDFSSDLVLETNSGSSLFRKRLRIANGTFTAGRRFRIQATIQTPAGKRSLVAAIGHSPYQSPFAG